MSAGTFAVVAILSFAAGYAVGSSRFYAHCELCRDVMCRMCRDRQNDKAEKAKEVCDD